MFRPHMPWPLTERELKRGSATLLVLALVDETARHGYDIGKLIETRSQGAISFHMASLYPLLYRMETRGWIVGVWRQPAGRKMLVGQRGVWQDFVAALDRVAGLKKV